MFEIEVTKELLKSMGACKEQVELFAEKFPKGLTLPSNRLYINDTVRYKNIMGFDMGWAFAHLKLTGFVPFVNYIPFYVNGVRVFTVESDAQREEDDSPINVCIQLPGKTIEMTIDANLTSEDILPGSKIRIEEIPDV